ncbi:Caspase recruitment domain [Mactra antiquata]
MPYETGQKYVVQSEETKPKKVADSSYHTMEACLQYESQKPSMSENNLSPYKPEDFSGEFRTLEIEPVKRSLEFPSLSDGNLSFNSLLQDTENMRVSATSVADNRKFNDHRSVMADSTISISQSGDSGLNSFNAYLTQLEQSSNIENNSYESTNISDTNLAQREASWRNPGSHGNRTQNIQWSDIQNINTEHTKVKTTSNNEDTYNQDITGRSQVVNFDENSQDKTLKQLKDKDMNVRYPQTERELNIKPSEDDSLEDMNQDDIPDIDVSLRKYQEELASPALKGNNVIIVAPTGSGKTRVAMRIIQEHIRQQKGHGIAKVIFLVNQVALANQQGEACRELLKKYTCEVITGESQRKMKCLKDFIHKREILVVTAQVLLDAIINKEIDGISCFSLIVFDECHHTYANHTFNAIMGRYMDRKFLKDDAVLPQIVGLTASVGVGKSRTIDKAVKHIKHLMANLDAHEICTVNDNITELREHVSLPEEETRKVPRREDDPYGDSLRKLMGTIEKRMAQSSLVREIPEAPKLEAVMKPPAQKGTAQYTQWVSKLWKEIVKIKCPNARRFLTPCRQHLDLYNNALIIYNDARMEDAKHYLDQEMNKWKDEAIMDDNEKLLYGAYTSMYYITYRIRYIYCLSNDLILNLYKCIHNCSMVVEISFLHQQHFIYLFGFTLPPEIEGDKKILVRVHQ